MKAAKKHHMRETEGDFLQRKRFNYYIMTTANFEREFWRQNISQETAPNESVQRYRAEDMCQYSIFLSHSLQLF